MFPRISTKGRLLVKDIKLSEVQELAAEIEYLVLKLIALQESFPESERLIQRLENASITMETSVKQGIHKLERVMMDLDYTHIDKTLASLVQRQMGSVVSAMQSIRERYRDLQEVQNKTDEKLDSTKKLLSQLDNQLDGLHQAAQFLPKIESERMIFAASFGFVGGIIILYALSLITWLPKPFFATGEQSVLLQMVQDGTLKLEKRSPNSIEVHIDYDALSKNKIGEKQ